MTSGRCAGPRNGSRSARRQRNAGPGATASRRRGHERPLQPATTQPEPHPPPGGTPGAASTNEPALGTRTDRRTPQSARLNLPRDPAPRGRHPPGPSRPATREPIRRYEHPHPGDLVHVDIKKLGNIPDGGGWRTQGRARGNLNRTATAGHHTDAWGGTRLGYAYLHTAIDDHSRLAYTEILHDERQDTAAAFRQRAHAWFSSSGITVRRVLTDNGSCYKSRLWHDTCTQLGVTVKTRPYRPQTNGNVERFHRTMTDEWAYAKPYRSETARRAALPAWLHAYNHHRHHTALGGPPASRVPNLWAEQLVPGVSTYACWIIRRRTSGPTAAI
ncbi:Beta-glucosidase [Micromonospora noduli]|nr:Beta-glucosidase [Micromonospora noduli]